MIRKATLSDLNALVDIENLSFNYDLITKRNFQYLLTRANAETIVKEENGMILGYAMLLFHSGTSLSRLYSFAVHPQHRKKRIGEIFFREIERISFEHDC
ncbi:MAG: GNAT family N-acetyltransferase, partial [Spirochaetes bacterium]|nr:GNAT family N-acetyltransferase [Spirochaetota bacterium]